MKRADWMPSKKDEQLAMGKNWFQILSEKREAWSVPEEMTTKLHQATNTAEAENKIPAGERNAVSNARLKTAFGELTAVLRDIKRRYFFIPPLTEADMAALGLRIKDTTPTPVADPTGQAEAVISYPGRTQLQLRINHVEGTPLDTKANYGCRVYYGVYAAAETPPATGKELRDSKFTRQKKMLFTFEPEDTGKTAYFAIRYENSKGKTGPWGPMFSALIP